LRARYGAPSKKTFSKLLNSLESIMKDWIKIMALLPIEWVKIAQETV
jgi:hypothetical protein